MKNIKIHALRRFVYKGSIGSEEFGVMLLLLLSLSHSIQRTLREPCHSACIPFAVVLGLLPSGCNSPQHSSNELNYGKIYMSYVNSRKKLRKKIAVVLSCTTDSKNIIRKRRILWMQLAYSMRNIAACIAVAGDSDFDADRFWALLASLPHDRYISKSMSPKRRRRMVLYSAWSMRQLRTAFVYRESLLFYI